MLTPGDEAHGMDLPSEMQVGPGFVAFSAPQAYGPWVYSMTGIEPTVTVPAGPYTSVAELIAALQALPSYAKPLIRLPNGCLGPIPTPKSQRVLSVGRELYEPEGNATDYPGQNRIAAVVLG